MEKKNSKARMKKVKKEKEVKQEILAPETLPVINEVKEKNMLSSFIPVPDSRAEEPAKYNLKNVLNFITAKWRQLGEKVLVMVDSYTTLRMKGVLEKVFYYTPHEREQILYRSILAKDCTKKGYCTHCGCSTVNYDKYRGTGACDKEGCYPALMPKSEWERYKIDNNIKL